MMVRMRIAALAALGFCLAGSPPPASAQGLIRKLPAAGTWVRYEGTYSQEESQSGAAGKAAVEWTRHLWLKSLESETAEYEGKMEQCRWFEIKILTGKKSEMGIDTGPVGERIYKVLVPESRISAAPADKDGIPASFLPIVKGYRKIGKGAVKPFKAAVLQVYPVISLLMHYKPAKTSVGPQAEDVTIILGGQIKATKITGNYVMESLTRRSTNDGQVWLSDDVPFGLAKWHVDLIREAKPDDNPREAFEQVNKISVDMQAAEKGTDAQSDLVIP